MHIRDPFTLLFVGAHPDDETFGVGGTLAKYAAAGFKVVYACGTQGEVGSFSENDLGDFNSPGQMRWAELVCAADILQLAELVYLGYRDSGMPGSPDNHHPQALAAAPQEEVTSRVIRVIRAVKPQVVITFDPIGGYRHPDHIAIHQATVRAFYAANDPQQFSDSGSAFTPQKLYFHVFPKSFLKLAIKILPLLGQNPRRFGRNHDVDLVSLTAMEFPVHARIRIRGIISSRKSSAAACHKSQLGSGPPLIGRMKGLTRLLHWIGTDETFMRAHPSVLPGQRVREKDLFEGII